MSEIEHDKTPDEHATLVGGSSAKRVLNCPASVGVLAKMQERLDAEADTLAEEAASYLNRAEADLDSELKALGEEKAAQAQKLRNSLNQSSTYADEGTALHEVMAYIVDNDIQRDEIINDPHISELWDKYQLEDARLWDCVYPAFEAFEKKCNELLAESDDPDAELMIRVEAHCVMPGIVDANGEPQFGSTDVLIRGPKRTVVWDWKFGAGVPVYASYKVKRFGDLMPGLLEEAEDEFGNDQLMYYARAAMHSFPQYFDENWAANDADPWPVDLVICQPRTIEDGAVSEFTTNLQDLEDFRLDLADAVEEALTSVNPTMKKGSWCRFEACKTVCPLHVSAAEKAAQVGEKLGKLALRASSADLPAVTAAGGNMEKLPANGHSVLEYSAALAAMLDIADIVEPYIKEAQSQAHAFLEAGGKIPGYKLVPKRAGHDKWKEDRSKVDAFLARKGLDLDARREAWVPISPAQARTKLKALGLDMKDASEKHPLSKERAALEKLVAPGVSSGSTLAPADDPRPDFIRSADRVAALADKLKQLSAN